MWKSFQVRIAGLAGFTAGIIGLLFALYGVQGEMMPTMLAAFLKVILWALLTIALGLLIWVSIAELVQFLSRRSTTAPWISDDAPGYLDCQADGGKAAVRLQREMERFQKDIGRLSRGAEKHREIILSIQRNAKMAPSTRQAKANQFGRQLNRSSVYIGERLDLFRKLTAEIVRDYETLVPYLDSLSSTQSLMSKVEKFGDAAKVSIIGTNLYRRGVLAYERANLTRVVRASAASLGQSLDGLVKCFDDFGAKCALLHDQLKRRCASWDESSPDKGGSPS